ncbi:MAG: cadherin repeat domain-containing protein, partial [Flavobacteriaceae bacterium]|nr:cadherin repeat domain-containing protein [Flavobacteriaceae bacterium]
MKHSFTFRKALSVITITILFSCANDDDTNQANVISLEDLTAVIDENPTNGQVIGNVVATQTIGGATLDYTIDSQSPSGALAINSSTGEMTVADNTLFDFETNQIITATVSLAGGTNTANVTINLNNLPDLLVNYTETIRPD